MDNAGVIDLTVSYDGTWQKRGFTSHHGVGVINEVQTGLIVDYDVLSNNCHACALAENRLGAGTPKFKAWQAAHIACERNFDGDGSRGCQTHLEPLCGGILVTIHTHPERRRFEYICCSDAVGTLWARSHRCQVDSVNHAEKRMGTALRKAAKSAKLGGRGVGRLTTLKATKLQTYYGRALRGNVGNVDATKEAVWATLSHSMSTNDDPHHQRCPHGPDSWCIFNKSVALGLPMPLHETKTVGTLLDHDVAQELIPIYERMTDDNLLLRMTTGGTQNANESLNSLIWLYCPKTQFVGHQRVVCAGWSVPRGQRTTTSG